jgi:hypothetical protein
MDDGWKESIEVVRISRSGGLRHVGSILAPDLHAGVLIEASSSAAIRQWMTKRFFGPQVFCFVW